MLKGLKICYFGHYDPNYSRNRVIIKALKRMGATVIECRSLNKKFHRYYSLFKMGIQIKFDIMIVGFIGHTDVPIAKLICSLKKRPLIFDALISLYDTNVWDRKLVKPNSFRAQKYYYIDWLSCKLADIILLDTKAHIDYFTSTFKIPHTKFRRLWVGTDDEIMIPYPGKQSVDHFKVFFYGSFTPLHGIEYVIQAAHILESMKEPIKFIIVGSGQTFPEIQRLVKEMGIKTVQFIGWVPYEELPLLMSESHVCLGIFGRTPKAQRVIPNKVFDALAIARPVITADTPAVRETFKHGENIYLCPNGDSRALAEAILTLKQSSKLRINIAINGYKLFKEKFSIQAIAKDLATILIQTLDEKIMY